MMDAPSFDPKGLLRPVLLFIVLYLSVILISLMTMAKPAHADGQVDLIYVYTINSGGFNNGCFGKASVAEAMQCNVDFTNSNLDGDYAQISSWGGYDIAVCPRAVAHDLTTVNPYLYSFKESPIYRLFAYMPPNPKLPYVREVVKHPFSLMSYRLPVHPILTLVSPASAKPVTNLTLHTQAACPPTVRPICPARLASVTLDLFRTHMGQAVLRNNTPSRFFRILSLILNLVHPGMSLCS
jgi:hypothetical protein